jgi:hypothetical protein
MVRKTRKVKEVKEVKKEKKEKSMTIPELRKAFEHIESFIQKHDYDVNAFRKEWKKTFGKEVSVEAAKEYLDFLQNNKSHKSQEGGMAPVNYITRPGTDLPYGNFPPYVSSGFGIGVPQDSFSAQCGKENITPLVPATMGSNLVMKGGKKTRKNKKQKGGLKSNANLTVGGASLGSSLASVISEAMSRPFGMSSPPTTAQDLQMQSKGVLPQANGDPSQSTFSYSSSQPVFSAQASSASRTF